MSKREHIASVADKVFYTEGFSQVGIDRVVSEAGVALGTLYRHFGGKSGLVIGALQHREASFFEELERSGADKFGADCVLSLFDGLLSWADGNGGNGCFFLRAAADHPANEEIKETAIAHKHAFLSLIEKRLIKSGRPKPSSRRLAPRFYILFEGAVAACPVLGRSIAIGEAREAARRLLSKEAVRKS